jgi:FtsP/CotA-like multicopper oxidase with cupredoxin domain
MNSGQRIAIVLAAAVVLVGGFFLARGSSDEPTTSGDATETSEGTGGAQAPATTTATQTPTQTQEQPPPPRVESIRIRDGRPASGNARTLKYDSGETVRLRFSSNAASEIHIHGYDKYVNVPAGGSARTRFKADAEGIFEIEDHGTGELLANLEVRP